MDQIAEIEGEGTGRPQPGAAGAPRFVNSYSALPERFFSSTRPNAVSAPRLIKLNGALAEELDLNAGYLRSGDGIAMFAGNRFPETAQPIALAYAGHQFGNFVPQLGDGRALLIGDVVDRHGQLRDLQLKGSGRTAYSRGGDGRAALGPVLREYIVSEAMAALGIPTTRSLAAVATGDPVYREQPLPGAVLTRVAASHIRIGTFQFFAARGDNDGVKALADYAIGRRYPHCAAAQKPYLALLEAVIGAQAALVAKWMCVGFIHGVMNTDNMTISGETIDYGPCAFMDTYHPATVFSSIDSQGRYAFANQPHIAVWNLARLAETLLPLIDPDEDAAVAACEAALKTFQGAFEGTLLIGMRAKLGLTRAEQGDPTLVRDLLELMARAEADFTLTFRELGNGDGSAARDLFIDRDGFDQWHRRWMARLAVENLSEDQRHAIMATTNPFYIPRNHRVEAVIEAAVERSDFAPFEEMLSVVTRPFDRQPGMERYAEPPALHERVTQTFCGT